MTTLTLTDIGYNNTLVFDEMARTYRNDFKFYGKLVNNGTLTYEETLTAQVRLVEIAEKAKQAIDFQSVRKLCDAIDALKSVGNYAHTCVILHKKHGEKV
jgi:hypothetical protein